MPGRLGYFRPMRVHEIVKPADQERAYAIRFEVFVDEQGVPAHEELDALDGISLHALVVDDNEAVGTGRLIPPDGEHAWGKIGRMAVLKSHRGRGVGSLVLEFLVQQARERGHVEVRLSSQDHAMPFYARHGFLVCSDGFLDCGIPHHWMRRTL